MTRIKVADMDTAELIDFYDSYCKERGIKKRTKEAHDIWWAMFYAHKEGRDWIIHEKER